MWISTTSNASVTNAAKEKGLGEAMNVALTAASSSGLILATGVLFYTAFWFNILFWWYGRYSVDIADNLFKVVSISVTFTIGASFAAFFYLIFRVFHNLFIAALINAIKLVSLTLVSLGSDFLYSRSSFFRF